jgi:lipoyl(octanoyl) transferase
VEAVTCRLLPFGAADGATNMAADEALVRSAATGIASLRFYGWPTATVSLGYFQPASARLSDPLLAPLPWVRRPSGGATLVHHHELTYALALPAGPPWHGSEPWMPRMHRIIAAALAQMGLAGQVEVAVGPTVRHGGVLCFQQFTPGDLLCRGRKIVGSAQRKYHLCLMQHGSILLARSEYAPELPGIVELTGNVLSAERVAKAVVAVFCRDTGWRLEVAAWSERERHEVAELVREKYATARWNARR